MKDISYTTVENCVSMLCYKLHNDVKEGRIEKPDGIVTMMRGGALIGVLLSHTLSIPVKVIEYSSRTGRGDDRNHNNIIDQIPFKNVLLVDDICDSGHTLAEVDAFLQAQGATVISACLFRREDSIYTPTYTVNQLSDDDGFINFPWEKCLFVAEPVVIS